MIRPVKPFVLYLTANKLTTPIIDLGTDFSAGKLYLPFGYTSTTLSFYTWDPATQLYVQEFSAAGTPITLAVTQDAALPLPDQLFASRYLRIVTDEDDSDKPVGLVIRA